MSRRELFRYCWIKVTDEDSRAAQMHAALELQCMLASQQATSTDEAEARALRMQAAMARTYLGGDAERGIRVVIFSPTDGGSLSVDLVATMPPARSQHDIEITTATMPSGYTLAEASAWLDTPVGAAWSRGALACRLVHAVVDVEVSRVVPEVSSDAALA